MLILGPMVIVSRAVRDYGIDLHDLQIQAVIARDAEAGKPLPFVDSMVEELIPARRGLSTQLAPGQLSEALRINYKAHLTDEIIGSVWWGLLSTILGAVAACCLSTVLAGFFVRREYGMLPGRGRIRLAGLLPYAELVIFSSVLLYNPLKEIEHATSNSFERLGISTYNGQTLHIQIQYGSDNYSNGPPLEHHSVEEEWPYINGLGRSIHSYEPMQIPPLYLLLPEFLLWAAAVAAVIWRPWSWLVRWPFYWGLACVSCVGLFALELVTRMVHPIDIMGFFFGDAPNLPFMYAFALLSLTGVILFWSVVAVLFARLVRGVATPRDRWLLIILVTVLCWPVGLAIIFVVLGRRFVKRRGEGLVEKV
jgi:hypothetical protein